MSFFSKIAWIFLLITIRVSGYAQNSQSEIITFPSKDGLPIEAQIFETDKNAPVILLCHQARYNKHEYNDIAPRLNDLGFSCMAIDQRSGGDLRGFKNTTYEKAKKEAKPVGYLDAEQDILAAIDFLYERYKKPVILWGSSYSSTLALYIAKNNPKVIAVVSFSPGNYFAKQKGSLVKVLEDFDKPFFITSSAKEAPGIQKLLELHQLQPNQVVFVPSREGWHGSKALWEGQKGGAEYWKAITDFLILIKS